jgi:hypothetical protein
MLSGLSSRIAAAIAGGRSPRGAVLRGILVAAALGSACTTNNVLGLRPDVDVGVETAAVPKGGGFQDLVPDDPYLQKADEAAQASAGPSGPGVRYVWSGPAASGAYAGSEPSASQPAQPDMIQPAEVDEPVDASEDEPVVVAGYPHLDDPTASDPAPMSAPPPLSSPPPMSQPALMPADEIACRQQLRRLGVVFREMTPIDNGGACRIDHPLRVSGLPDGVALKPAATLNCRMTLAFAKWTKEELNPTARRKYWSRVKAIHQLSSYSCRRINGSRTMSEHSKGNAIDVGRIELASGRDIDVEAQGLFAFRSRAFLDNVRADGCDYFTTVLGPGYNYDHRNHFHFDLAHRRGGRHACH